MKSAEIYRYDEEKIIQRKHIDEKQELLKHIYRVKRDIECAYSNFNVVTEPDLVDSYIYELNAMQMKYQYLLQQAKELGIIANKISYTDNKHH